MTIHAVLALVLPAVLSFVAAWYIYIPVLHMAQLKQMVDHPNHRKLQQAPVPVMGGMAVFFGLICGYLLSSCLTDLSSTQPLIATMGLLLIVGMLDDMLGVSPRTRFFIEMFTIAGVIYGSGQCIDSLHGLFGYEQIGWYVAVPFTIFACVGIINAINMIDGVNGLSSGLCATCSLLFAYHFIQGHDYPNAALNLMLTAALIPFWIHNVIGRKSRMFIGDAGTMVMGLLMSWNVIKLLCHHSEVQSYRPGTVGPVGLVLSILAVPVFDTLRVIVLRLGRGCSPFQADRTHLHHIIYDYSSSQTLTALSEILLTLLLYCLCLLTAALGYGVTTQFLLVLFFSLVTVWGLYFLLSINSRLDTGFAFRTRRLLTSMRQGNTSWWRQLQEWVDRGA